MPRDTAITYFHEWDGLAEKWITDEESFDQDFPTKPFDPDSRDYSSVAEWVIEVIFGLTVSNDSSQLGSTLPGYDIKSRDAYQMIQLSLSSELANQRLVECYADGNGVIHFYKIGENNASIGASDIFYKINTSTLSKQCNNVLVIGYDPPPKRYNSLTSQAKSFDLLSFVNSAELSNATLGIITDTDADADRGSYPLYHIWGEVLGPDQCDYYRESYIEYGNPHFDQKRAMEELGIITGKFETVATYIYKITVPFFKQASTRIEFGNRTPRFVELPEMGKLQERDWQTTTFYKASLCQGEGEPPAIDRGVRLPRSNEKKFLGVREVYIYGYRLKQIQLDFYKSGSDRVEGPADFIVDVDSTQSEPFRLTRGQDYVVNDDPADNNYRRIVFSANIHPNYLSNFGGKVDGTIKASIRFSPASIYTKRGATFLRTTFQDIYDPSIVVEGFLKDGQTEVTNQTLPGVVNIFPINEGQSGYVVEKIIVIYDWDNPCIAVYDETNLATKLNLQQITVEVFPIIIRDDKPPIAWTNNGSTVLLDPAEVIPDFDAATEEDLDSKDYAKAFTSLETGDIKITLPFLDADGCQTVSGFIYDMQNEVIKQTNYICSPDAEPVLGELIEGKTINSIDYSYQDGSQYLISVNAGPRWAGVSGWDTAIYQNKTERLQLEGIVTDVYPDNVRCQVQLEQLGMVDCVNGSKQILERGDRVSVTVQNNPVAK